MTIWEPKNGEFLETRIERENEFDKIAVSAIKNNIVIGHLTKGKSGRFAKTISFFLSTDNICRVAGKRVNLGDGDGLQIPCNLHFTGQAKFINKLKEILPSLM